MATFQIRKSITIDAAPDVVHALINDFHHWTSWSPWEGLDPELKRTYSGPNSGVGATYTWEGKKKAGAGSMEIIESSPSSIVIDLVFLKPFEATNLTTFDIAPAGTGTQVTWTMTGSRNPLMSILGKIFFDKMIGKDFDKGLADLKAAAATR